MELRLQTLQNIDNWQQIVRILILAKFLYINKTSKVRITWNWGALGQQLLQWKSNKNQTTWVRVSSLRHPACNAHASYCHLRPAPLYNTFSTLSHKRHDFRERERERERKKESLLMTKCVLIFSKTFVWNIFRSKKKWARYDKKCVSVFM